MKEFTIMVREVWIQPVKIKADSLREAVQKVENGKGESKRSNLEFSHSLEPEYWTAEDNEGHQYNDLTGPEDLGGIVENARFMSANEKELVLKEWKRFLAKGLRWEDFTKRLYGHLVDHCLFIAHYDRQGFYATYFESGDRVAKFLTQFDARNNDPMDGVPSSIEYGITCWAADKNDNEYADINQAMIEAAAPYIDNLLQKAQEAQRAEDIGEAKQLLAKHGIALKENNDAD